MSRGVVYGILSDTYVDSEVSSAVAYWLKYSKVDRLVLNGNLFSYADNFAKRTHDIRRILDAAGESGIETYVNPGTLETLVDFNYQLARFELEYPNIHNTLLERYNKIENHRELFISGLPNYSSGEFYFSYDVPAQSGIYIRGGNSFMPLKNDKDLLLELANNPDWRLLYVTNLSEINGVLDSPGSTLVFSNFPSKFEGEGTIDYRHVGVEEDGYLHNAKDVIKKIKEMYGELSYEKYCEAAKADFGIILKKENMGSTDLNKFYTYNGLKKVISSSYTGVAGIATDSSGKPIPEMTWTDELFWSVVPASEGYVGILEVEGDNVRYRNANYNLMLDIVTEEHLDLRQL